MLKALITAIAATAILLAQVAPAFACGVKLTVKSPKVRKASFRSSNPSTILLVGERDSRLAQDLRRKGHTVEHASTVSSARRDNYQVVVADDDKRASAQQRYPNAIVVSRGGTDTDDIEKRLARAPRKGGDRRVVARRDRGEILRAGPDAPEGRELRGSGGGTLSASAGAEAEVETEGPDDTPVAAGPGPVEAPEPAEAEPARRNERVAAAIDTRPERDEVEEPAEEAAPAAEAKWHREFYFATASNNLNARSKRRMRANAKWLQANPDVTVVIEGHTDTVGASEFNLSLGERRAEAARQFLIRQGVDGSRIEIVSKGEDEPAYSPGTSAKNRRVVLVQQ